MSEAGADLLDANVLVALASPDHVHHVPSHRWFSTSGQFATCPITQLALVRLLVLFGVAAPRAVDALEVIRAHERHEFWADDEDIDAATMRSVIGHRQVTDAHLVSLARRHGGSVATFDTGLHATFPDTTILVPIS